MDERVEIAAKAWWESHGAEPLWDDLAPSDRSVMLADQAAAIAALEAAGYTVARLMQVGERTRWDDATRAPRTVPVYRIIDGNTWEPAPAVVSGVGEIRHATGGNLDAPSTHVRPPAVVSGDENSGEPGGECATCGGSGHASWCSTKFPYSPVLSCCHGCETCGGSGRAPGVGTTDAGSES